MKKLPYLRQDQEHEEWCWAAIATGIERFLAPASTRTQCQTVTEEYKTPCCGEPLTAEQEPVCNRPALVPLKRLGWLNGEPIPIQPVSFELIRSEIDAGRPVCVFVRWREGDKLSDRGHYFVVTGYREAGRTKMLLLQDPFYGESEMPYEKLSSKDPGGGYRAGRGVWRGTFLLRSKRADVSAA